MIELLRTPLLHDAHMARALLEAAGIEATVRGDGTVGFGVSASVWVMEEDAERAREVLREMEE